ncbi:MAG: SDR family oxidoreductase [Thermostichales cyanobacterium SZTDM-1c_bins_54]
MGSRAAALADRVVVITGASSGIGEAVAMRAAVPGATLVLAARREGVLRTIQEVLTHRGAKVLVLPTDMGDPAQVQRLADQVLEQCGRVDILVNNAGYGQMGPLELLPLEAMQRQFQVNVFGLVQLTQALIPGMRAQGRGRIVNISSIVGQIGMPFNGIYSASKHALEAISDALRVELAPFGIQVVVVEPGPVQTEFFTVADAQMKSYLPDQHPYQAILKQDEDSTGSLKKNAWTADQVAEVVLRAMTDPRPAPRYTAFSGGKAMLGLMKLAPAPWLDQVWARLFAWQPK